jgi:hypothetical protein
LADFEDGGGGVPSIFRKPSSKLNPCDEILFAKPIIQLNHKINEIATIFLNAAFLLHL